MNKPVVKYRKDYQVPTHLIETVELFVDIYEDYTQVTSRLVMVSNSENPSDKLTLQGEEQKLLSIKLDDALLNDEDYILKKDSLTIKKVPNRFTLEIESQIMPQNNTLLMGLYKSGGNLCTQCEAEGFRRITYYLDRPDVLSVFTTTIMADKSRYPVLLSNGNLVETGDLEGGRHFAKWHDPFKKPCYLFAMVAGNLAHIEDKFTTCSGRKVTLKIFAAESVVDKCAYAMEALKKSMRWDEEAYGREYDLDIFMIVAINDFNFGAMENKGLNIFNDRYILVDAATATDIDYGNIDRVVGHEYFHNWSGNRVTLRDWFQLSLKEGFTVFREQSFCEYVGLDSIERIDQVRQLRAMQFPEDAGPLAHPVRPDSYIEMNNFYTMTIYEKGSEVIRMLHTILGAEKFRQGSDLYFSRNDGKAVTCDDFVQAMQDASGIDLTLFKRWYSQAGTPEIAVKSEYDEESCQYTIHLLQTIPATPGQEDKQPMHIPIAIGLLNNDGHDMSLQLTGEETVSKTCVLNLTTEKASFSFTNIMEKPMLSLLRGFSAPVKINYDYTPEELAFLMAHDSDPVARWEAGQTFSRDILFELMQQYQQGQPMEKPMLYLDSMRSMLKAGENDKGLKAVMLTIPDENYLMDFVDTVDVDAMVAAKQYLLQTIATELQDDLLKSYEENINKKTYQYTPEAAAERTLKNTCLNVLASQGDAEVNQLSLNQFKSANNMTDQFAALMALVNYGSEFSVQVLEEFEQQWQADPLVMDKWFAVQASAKAVGTFEKVKQLLSHPAYNNRNPNKVRALLGAFARNFAQFHRADGQGYQLIADQIIELDKINPMVAARLATSMAQWKRFTKPRQELMQIALERILAAPKLSKDVYEIVSKSLKA